MRIGSGEALGGLTTLGIILALVSWVMGGPTSVMGRCESDGCDASQGLTCNGFQCVLMPGHPCSNSSEECGAHAYCSRTSGLCECDSGYLPETDYEESTCFLSHASPCDGSWPCGKGAGLSCRVKDGSGYNPGMECQCESESVWSSRSKECIPSPTTTSKEPRPPSPAHSPVFLIVNGGTECPLNSFPYLGGCQCYEGYSPTSYGGPCLLHQGQRCSVDNVLQLQCNAEEGLDCVGGVCSCRGRGYNEEGKCEKSRGSAERRSQGSFLLTISTVFLLGMT